MKVLKISLITLFAAFLIAACAESPTANKTANLATPQNKTAASTPTPGVTEVASGATIYKEKCSRCHKDDGTGGKVEIEGTTIKAENLTTDKMKKMDDAEYIEVLNEGVKDEGMPAFKGKLTDDDMKSVVKYIRDEFQK